MWAAEMFPLWHRVKTLIEVCIFVRAIVTKLFENKSQVASIAAGIITVCSDVYKFLKGVLCVSTKGIPWIVLPGLENQLTPMFSVFLQKSCNGLFTPFYFCAFCSGAYENGEYIFHQFSLADNTLSSMVVHNKYGGASNLVLNKVTIYGVEKGPKSVTVNGNSASYSYLSTVKVSVQRTLAPFMCLQLHDARFSPELWQHSQSHD